MRVLVVGGAGYIGSVAVRYLKETGHEVCVFDNMSRGHAEAVPEDTRLIVGDLGSLDDLDRAFESGFHAVMHFAALSLVPESMKNPAAYFKNNIAYGLNLLEAMRKHSVNKLIFSSTAAVYGEPPSSPITEDFPLQPSNPYGESKLAFEKILKWYHTAFNFKYISLRYFNAAGAYDGAGEDHQPETHLIPIVLQVAQGKRSEITIFGDDYKTHDGTCVRDYIHVRDLADAHVKALEALASGHNSEVFNLGQGTGSSVKEVIEAAMKVTGKTISASVVERRPGDPSTLVASNAKIAKQLGWSPRFSQIETIIEDAWAWHQAHPFGYGKSG